MVQEGVEEEVVVEELEEGEQLETQAGQCLKVLVQFGGEILQ